MNAVAGLLAISVAAAAPNLGSISDQTLAAYAVGPFDKSAKMGRLEILGVNHGARVVADFPCSDLCPDYTTRIIHYAVPPGPECARIGGVKAIIPTPRGIARIDEAYCVSRVVARLLAKSPSKVLG